MTAVRTSKIAVAAFVAAIVGCASPVPPQHLVDARAAYDKGRTGLAAQLTPADLHTAKVALNQAEQAFEEDAESPKTFALSYVALRQAQLVLAKANLKAAEADVERADKQIGELREAEIARARGELAKAKSILAKQDQELAVRGEQLAAADQQLAATSEQLAAERAARAAAEAREREAMRKLAEAAALNVKEEKRGTVIVLPGNVLFESGKYELTGGAQQKLTLIAGTLAPQAENHDIVVEGHTDSRGTREFNMTLSQNRAQAVMNYLVARGVPQEAVTSVGIGPDRPIGDNSNRQGRAENRRVEIIVKPMKEMKKK
ncbi:MAG: OmpA family protein [Myxococcales bacterium]|nr:OmpA family protein [Myxococcales bacterium]